MSKDEIIISDGVWSKVELIRENGILIVRKTINDPKMSQREITLLLSLEHPHIIPVERADILLRQIYMPYIPIELTMMIERGPLSSECLHKYVLQIISAIKYLHTNKIAHLDLKTDNILIKDDHCYVIDFGLARRSEPGVKIVFDSGSRPYASPEILLGIPFEPTKSDIWSLAVCIFMCATGGFPITSMSFLEDQYYPSTMCPKLRDLLEGMFKLNPRFRYSIEDVSKHPWVTG